MSKISTGMIIGGMVGISSYALLSMDKKGLRKMQRRGQRLLHKAEDLVQDFKSFI